MKNRMLLVIRVVVLILCVGIIVYNIIPFFSYKTYTVPAEYSNMIIGDSPEGFTEMWESMPFLMKLSTFFTDVKINETGDLVLTLNKFMDKKWRNQFYETIEDARRNNVQISADYKEIRVSPKEWFVPVAMAVTAIDTCWVTQFFDGVPAEDITVDFWIMDEDTGAIWYHVTYPEENVVFTVTTSSIHFEDPDASQEN